MHWIRGNGEREVAEAVGAPEPPAGDLAAVTAALTAAELGDERARVLGELPLTLELDGVLYCHASPRRDDEMLTRLSTPERWEAALAGVPAGLVVAGHTHQQDDRAVGGVRFVNAGSVGLPYEGDGAARWLWIAGGEPELRHTAYDAAAAGAAHPRGRLARRALGRRRAHRPRRAARRDADLRGPRPLGLTRARSTVPCVQPRARERTATGLVVLASLLLVATTIAGYARLAVFDSDGFADRAAAALQEPSVRTVVGERVTDELVLPTEPDLIAARPLIVSAVSGVVSGGAFAGLFRRAVRDAHGPCSRTTRTRSR